MTAVGHPGSVPVTLAAPEPPEPSSKDQARSRRRALLWALLGGMLTTATVPPFGWWPLALPGAALLVLTVAGAGPRRRFAVGATFGLGLYVPSLWWMTRFSLPGGIFVGVLEATITGLAMVTAHPGRRRHPVPQWQTLLSVPAALVLAEVLRSLWPFGGLPLGGIDLGQADGPIADTVAFGGRLLLVACVALGGSALVLLLSNRVRSGLSLGGGVALVVVLSAVLPNGTHPAGTLRVAVVQGGGPLGLRASDANAARTWNAHLAATTKLTSPVDLIVWPENTVAVEHFDGSAEEHTLEQLAIDRHATLTAGVVEGAGSRHFRNAQVAWGPDGRIVDRFEKVRRVPYGEYFPLRAQIEGWGLAQLPPRDAIPGRTPGVLRTPAGTFAVAISYEGFFDDRSRGGVRAGGTVLLIPTNASSYTSSHVPTQQLSAARLRALETGRWTVQAAPTGFSAVIDDHGQVIQRTTLRSQEVLVQAVTKRTGLTPYVRFNDLPMLIWAAVALLITALGGPSGRRLAARRARRERPAPSGDAIDAIPS